MKHATAFVILALALASPALAETKWPERTVRLVVPYPPGGNVDGAARLIANKLQDALGQPFIIENKAGAGGLIGGEMVAKSAPDGYTLFVGANGPILFAPEIAKRRAYEWRKDFVAISTISMTPLVLQVHPSVPAKTLAEFFDQVKREPGKMTMASPGPGTTNHLLSEYVQEKLGLSWATAHYKGNAPATNDLIAGHVQFNFDQISVALPFLKDGRLRPLAVTGTKRAAWIPDVPTFAELGFKDIEGTTFTAVLAPAGTPREIVDKLHGALAKILKEPETAEKFFTQGAEAVSMSPDQLTRFLEREDATWIPVVRKANIKPD